MHPDNAPKEGSVRKIGKDISDTYRVRGTGASWQSEKPWQGVCSSGCYAAKTDKRKCKCKCRGEHHGKGQTHKPDEAKLTEFCEEQEFER